MMLFTSGWLCSQLSFFLLLSRRFTLAFLANPNVRAALFCLSFDAEVIVVHIHAIGRKAHNGFVVMRYTR